MMSTPARLRTSGSLLLPVLTSLLLTLSCSPKLVYQPGAVVPTASPLPYSATVRLAEIEAYQVEPGATMVVGSTHRKQGDRNRSTPQQGKKGLGTVDRRLSRSTQNVYLPVVRQSNRS